MGGLTLPYQMPYSYLFDKVGTQYKARDSLGRVRFHGTDPTAVAHSVRDVLVAGNGGRMFFTANSYSNMALSFSHGNLKLIELVGEGRYSSQLRNSGTDNIIEISNKSRVRVAHLGLVYTGASSGHAIYGRKDGADECSFWNSIIEDILIAGVDLTHWGIYALNPHLSVLDKIEMGRVLGGVGNGMKLENDSTTTNYGNLVIPNVDILLKDGGGTAFEFLSTVGAPAKYLNLMECGRLKAYYTGASKPSIACKFDQAMLMNIKWLELENYTTGIVYANSPQYIKIKDGYIGGMGTKVSGTPSVDCEINLTGYKTRNSGTSTGTGAQQTIAHGLQPTPNRVILSNEDDGANPYQSAAADGTNIYITAVNGKKYQWMAEKVY